jgi:hypothetical protein
LAAVWLVPIEIVILNLEVVLEVILALLVMLPTAETVRVAMVRNAANCNKVGAGCVPMALRVVTELLDRVALVRVKHIQVAQTMETAVEPDLTVDL